MIKSIKSILLLVLFSTLLLNIGYAQSGCDLKGTIKKVEPQGKAYLLITITSTNNKAEQLWCILDKIKVESNGKSIYAVDLKVGDNICANGKFETQGDQAGIFMPTLIKTFANK